MIFKIMLLDDEPILLEGLARNTDWRAHGFELACTARHGFDGLEKFLEFQVDAILTDIRMRFMDGLDFIRQVRRIQPDVEIAVMSAYDVFEYAQSACELGVVDYLLKPILDERLAQVLDTMHARLEKRKSVTARLAQAERYLVERKSALKQIARKRLLLDGGNLDDTLAYASLPELQTGERVHVALLQNNEEPDAQLLSIPVEQLFAGYMGGRVLMHTVFDNGTVCLALRSDSQGRVVEEEIIDRALSEAKQITRETLTVTLGPDVESWADIARSYRAAEKQMRFARMLGITGLAMTPVAEETGYYPRDLEYGLSKLLMDAAPDYLKDWEKQFLAWCQEHEAQYAFAARSMVLKMLQRLVEMREINLTEYEYWRGQLEGALALPWRDSIQKLDELIEKLCDSRHRGGGIVGGYLNSLAERVKAYALEHMEDPDLNVRAVADAVHISAPYLGRVFKKVTGMSFGGYLTQQRLERAQTMLFNADMRIGDIASAVGFENQSYFQVLFKKKTGMTPGDYRAKHMGAQGRPV